MYWAQALAEQGEDAELRERFTPVARALAENEAKIVGELAAAEGHAVDIGGYYDFDQALAGAAMRPSATLNAIIDGLSPKAAS